MDAGHSTSSVPVVTSTTVLSLLAALSLLIIACWVSLVFIPIRRSENEASGRGLLGIGPRSLRAMFVWHLFDCLIHLIFEGSFIYNCFFTYQTISTSASTLSGSLVPKWAHSAFHTESPEQHLLLTPPGTFFLGREDRLYGSRYGDSATAKLWQEYARADRRWGGADLTIISLELLTVFGAGPLAAFICYSIAKITKMPLGSLRSKYESRLWFTAIVLATAELYGGFMTFAPEWLSGSTSLDTSNFMYLWLYLAFFNLLWVVFPLWVLSLAFDSVQSAFVARTDATATRSTKKKSL